MQTLINASRSKRGWSYYGAWFKCKRYWAYTNKAPFELGSSDAQKLGSMVHVGLAHYFARRAALQAGGFSWNGIHVDDPEFFFEPEQSMEEWSALNDADEFLEQGLATYEDWLEFGKHKYGPNYKVVAVEEELNAVLGDVDFGQGPTWGLWLYDLVDGEYVYTSKVEAHKDKQFRILPSLLEFEGHSDHGTPIVISRRVDLVVDSDTGKAITIDDHKVTGGDTSATREVAYRPSGEFAVSRILGRQKWGAGFKGCRIHFVATHKESSQRETQIHDVRPTHTDFTFAQDLFVAAHEIATAEVNAAKEDGSIDFWQFTPTRNMDVCSETKFPCKGLELCRLGPAGVVNGKPILPQYPQRKSYK